MSFLIEIPLAAAAAMLTGYRTTLIASLITIICEVKKKRPC